MPLLRIPSLGASATSQPPIPNDDASGAPVVVPDVPMAQPNVPLPVPTIPVPMPPQQAPAARTLLQAYPWIVPVGGSLLGLLVGLIVGVAVGKRRRSAF